MKSLSLKIQVLFSLLLIGIFVLTACGKDEPERSLSDIEVAETGITIDFSNTEVFETGLFEDGASLTIADSQYLIHTTNTEGNRYLVGIGGEELSGLKNVTVEVEVQVQEGRTDNWFGVMCRVNEANEGYAFLVGTDGFWAIARVDKTSLDFLENWRETDLIKQGRNTLNAYCINDYLALYINGNFVGDHKDNLFEQAGNIGLIAGGAQSNAVTVAFDNLVVRSAYFEGQPNTETPIPSPLPTDTFTPEPIQLSPIPLATLELVPLAPASTETPTN